jgi:hypothetical protein
MEGGYGTHFVTTPSLIERTWPVGAMIEADLIVEEG